MNTYQGISITILSFLFTFILLKYLVKYFRRKRANIDLTEDLGHSEKGLSDVKDQNEKDARFSVV